MTSKHVSKVEGQERVSRLIFADVTVFGKVPLWHKPGNTEETMDVLLIPLPTQDPIPEAVEPTGGPAAGGTVITITGTDLDTATKEDVSVTVGADACQV